MKARRCALLLFACFIISAANSQDIESPEHANNEAQQNDISISLLEDFGTAIQENRIEVAIDTLKNAPKEDAQKLAKFIKNQNGKSNDPINRILKEVRKKHWRHVRKKLQGLSPTEKTFVGAYLAHCPKIIGGECTQISNFPWQASLAIKKNGEWNLCSGARISKHYLLTAAHCVDKLSGNNLHNWKRVDTTDIRIYLESSKIWKGKKAGVAGVFIHPKWKQTGRAFDYDLALLALDGSAPDTPKVKIRSAHVDPRIGPAWVAGWGRYGNQSAQNKSPVIQAVKINLMDQAQCARQWEGSDFMVTDQMLCAGDSFKGTCRGDSGGPLVVGSAGNEQVIGVVSWAPTEYCGDDPDRPHFGKGFIRTSLLREWLYGADGECSVAELCAAFTENEPGLLFYIS